MRSFRFKLALRATLAFTLGMAAVSIVSLTTLRVTLDRELNSSILNVASIQAASVADRPSGEMRFHEWELTPEEATSVRDLVRYAQVWSTEGESLLRSRYMTADLPVSTDALMRASDGELVWDESEFADTEVRMLFYPLERLGPAHEAHVLQVAAPLASRNGMLRRAGLFFALLTTLLAVATFGGSWWLAGSAVRPIHEVIDQTEEIGAGSLDRGIQAYADTFEYRRLVDVLNTMLARIRSAFEAQRRFTADASHELRSPLTVMRGEIELALRRSRSSEEYVDVLESTLEEVVRLSTITEELLTLARSDSGALEARRELVDVSPLVERVVERLRPSADEKAIDLEYRGSGGVTAMVDPGLLGQAAWNLVDNAVKFAPRGGSVSVSVSTKGDEVVVAVEDTGPGFGDMDPESAFERFFRADSARTHGSETAGAGLGLAIVKAVAEAHDGRVSAAERSGGGARFTLRLPVAEGVSSVVEGVSSAAEGVSSAAEGASSAAEEPPPVRRG